MINFIPSTSKNLERIINEPLMSGKAIRYFEFYRNWSLHSFSKDDNKKNCIITLNNLCSNFYYYFCLLSEYATNLKDFEFLNPDNYTTQEDVYRFTKDVSNTFITEIAEKMLDALDRVFSFREDCIRPIRLRENLTNREIQIIYKKFMYVYTNFVKEVHDLELKLIYEHSNGWYSVLRSEDLWNFSQGNHFSQETTKLTNKPMLIKLLNIESKITFNDNKIIRTELLSMDTEILKSQKVYGLLYNSDINKFIANNRNVTNNTFVTIDDLKKNDVDASVFFDDANDDKDYDKTVDSLLPKYTCLPINNIDDILNNPEVTNVIELSPDNEPFGVFIYENNLTQCFSQVCSLCSVAHLPLLVMKSGGDLKMLNWQDIFSQVREYIKLRGKQY